VPEIFPGMNVGQMDFNRGDARRRNRIAQGDAGMGVGSRVQDNDIPFPLSFLNPTHKLALQVALAKVHHYLAFFRLGTNPGLNFSQSRPSIHLRLALAEQV